MGVAAGGAAALALPLKIARAAAAELGDDGLYHQDWFVQSFLELEADLTEAAEAGKHFAVMWEQAGCPFCRKTHEINLARPDIADYLKENFAIVQLNLFGAREVTDFDGETDEERAIARRWAVNFTPTIQFFPNDPAEVAGKDGRTAELARIQGYLPPFYFYHFFEWIRSGAQAETGFQRYSNDKVKEYADKGVTPQDWVLK
ncbi:thioredoxin [Breoghania sp. L-A4]|nr:thioredoxin [Breoghania sp. L-A4]